MTPDIEEISKPNSPPPIHHTLVSTIVFRRNVETKVFPRRSGVRGPVDIPMAAKPQIT